MTTQQLMLAYNIGAIPEYFEMIKADYINNFREDAAEKFRLLARRYKVEFMQTLLGEVLAFPEQEKKLPTKLLEMCINNIPYGRKLL